MDAVLGRNVTLTTLLVKPEYILIIWNFNNGEEMINVATLTTAAGLKTGPQFEGRATINATNGNLYLGALRPEDSGDYTINVVEPDGITRTSETQLRVLGE